MLPSFDVSPIDPHVSCNTCQACCCQLEVILMGEDQLPAHLTHEDAWGGEVMRRLDDGWCIALDRDTLLCKIYERRPGVCREYDMGGLACIEERAHLDERPGQLKQRGTVEHTLHFTPPGKANS